jgi:hypothetical protein
LVRLIFSRDVTQASTPAADGELGDVVVPAGDVVVPAGDVADDAAPGGFWLAHAVMTSPHAATAKTPKVIVRSRTR